MKRKNPETSNEAFRSLKASEVRETYQQILASLDVLGKATFEELAAHMKCSRDKVWKRLSEMERLEMIYRPGTKKVLKSGRQGYEWMRTNPTKTDQQRIQKPSIKEERQLHNFAEEIIAATNSIQRTIFD